MEKDCKKNLNHTFKFCNNSVILLKVWVGKTDEMKSNSYKNMRESNITRWTLLWKILRIDSDGTCTVSKKNFSGQV